MVLKVATRQNEKINSRNGRSFGVRTQRSNENARWNTNSVAMAIWMARNARIAIVWGLSPDTSSLSVSMVLFNPIEKTEDSHNDSYQVSSGLL